MKLREHEIVALVLIGIVALGIFSWKHNTCTNCQNRFAAMIGSWPGSGPGVGASPLAGATGG